jgi:hypothetical protein
MEKNCTIYGMIFDDTFTANKAIKYLVKNNLLNAVKIEENNEGPKYGLESFEIDYKKTGKKGIGFYLLPKKIIDRMINIELKPNNDKKHITTIYAIFDGFLDKKEEEKVNHIEENQDEIIEKIEIDEDKL